MVDKNKLREYQKIEYMFDEELSSPFSSTANDIHFANKLNSGSSKPLKFYAVKNIIAYNPELTKSIKSHPRQDIRAHAISYLRQKEIQSILNEAVRDGKLPSLIGSTLITYVVKDHAGKDKDTPKLSIHVTLTPLSIDFSAYSATVEGLEPCDYSNYSASPLMPYALRHKALPLSYDDKEQEVSQAIHELIKSHDISLKDFGAILKFESGTLNQLYKRLLISLADNLAKLIRRLPNSSLRKTLMSTTFWIKAEDDKPLSDHECQLLEHLFSQDPTKTIFRDCISLYFYNLIKLLITSLKIA